MKILPIPFRSANPAARKPRGMAIVVVVSLMALLTLMVLAFLLTGSTNRNASNVDVSIRQADSLAEVAKETVIADVVAEMKAGATSSSKSGDGKASFIVDNPKAMVPYRSVKPGVDTDARFKLLVKQSAGGIKFHDIAGASAAGSTRASKVTTATAAVDGRKIAEIRWSAPKLFEPGADLTPAQVPDWIYTTRNGANPAALAAANKESLGPGGVPNPDYIVGRYAYQVYDVSGLLDANVAGNLSTAPPAGVFPRKGSLVWADLSVLPGATSSVSKIADWRRSCSASKPVEDFIREWGGLYGWIRTPLVGGKSDNVFLSRMDLLAYQKKNPSVIPDATLPYFTTASRELNQPAWSPTSDAGTGFQYKSNRDGAAAVNRRFLGVRVAGEFTRRDGTKAKIGEPLVKTRFPLSRIKAFEENNKAEAESYFGLVTAQTSGTTVISWTPKNLAAGKIKRLDQVAAENREPDFFETLKAGLLEGSLGNAMTDDGFFLDRGRDAQNDYQILRIGASIIDQWDVDDNPTIIQYGLTNPLTGVRPDDVAGVENLPYFHFLGESRFRRRDTAAPPNDSTAATFITFQLWNPHKNAADGKVAAGVYRLAFAGKSRMEWRTNTEAGYVDPGYSPYNRDSPTRTAAFGTDYLQFTVSSAANFSQPIYLKPGKAGVSSSKPADTISAGGAPVIGYNVGEVSAPYTSVALHPKRYNSNGMFARYDVPMAFALQKNIAGTWVSYQMIPEWNKTHGFVIGALVDNSNRLYAANGDYVNLHGMLIDPRTTRYGISTTTGGTDAMNKTTGARAYDNKFWPPSLWTTPTAPLRRIPEQYQGNDQSASSRIVHRDTKRRPADGGAPFTDPSQRPEILNRPFQSVADMGLAFRDDPWTTVNFFGDPEDATHPGDGVLLDLFSLTEKPVRAGVVNPNAAPVPVLKALLAQAAVREGAALTTAQAEDYAKSIRDKLDLDPLLNPADIAILAGKVATKSNMPGFKNNKDIQVITRALADVANVRTWNLLVDVIAQSGRLSPGTSAMDRFIAQAERRYWYHVAIDRFTGEIVSIQKESPSE